MALVKNKKLSCNDSKAKSFVDIIFYTLSRLVEDKKLFIDSTCFHIQSIFNFTSVVFVDEQTDSIIAYESYTQEYTELSLRVDSSIRLNGREKVYVKYNDFYVYHFPIYMLNNKLAILYCEYEVELSNEMLENMEEVCDIVGILYNHVLLYRKLEANKTYINKILDTQTNFILITDGYNIKQVNKTTMEFFGYSTFRQFTSNIKDIGDYFIEDDGLLSKVINNKNWMQCIVDGTLVDQKVKLKDKNKDVHIFQINTNGKKIVEEEEEEEVYVITFTDITALEKQQQTILEHSRVSALGEMITNIAHQWRQPLNVISVTTADLRLQSMFEEINSDSLIDSVDMIDNRVEYLSNTIDNFKNFMTEKKEFKKVILQDRIKKTICILQNTLDENNIKLILNIDEKNLIEMTMIVGELDQVLINIINNAKDILILRDIQNKIIKLSLTKQNSKVLITVEDNAGGIKKDILSKIFDPYFTTKHQSEGTGLGLYISKKLVQDSLDGRLYIKNTNLGAKFFIELG